jgi:hypothetical protein
VHSPTFKSGAPDIPVNFSRVSGGVGEKGNNSCTFIQIEASSHSNEHVQVSARWRSPKPLIPGVM